MHNYAYEFGRSVAHIKGDSFTMRDFADICRNIGLESALGSNGLRDAMIGAFDEYQRVARIYDSRNEQK